MDLDAVIARYYAAVDEFSRGDPAPVKALYSRAEDVALANPFGPAVSGWENVSQRLDFASARFGDGQVLAFERVAAYVGADLATILENERWTAKVGGRGDLSEFELRVTTTFRLEDGEWKIVHRHADPIATPDEDGPIRAS